MTGEAEVDAEQMTLAAGDDAAQKPKRRKRRTKAEMEMARAAEEGARQAMEELGIVPPSKKRGRPSRKDKEAQSAAMAAATAAVEGAGNASVDVARKAAVAALGGKSGAGDASAEKAGAGARGAGARDGQDAPVQAQARTARRAGATGGAGTAPEKAQGARGGKARNGGGQGGPAAQNADVQGGRASKGDGPAKAGAEQRAQADAQGAPQGSPRNRRNRRNRRNGNNHQRREVVPSATRDELASLEDDALVARALELSVDPTEYGERDDLVSAVYDALLQSEGFVEVEGILDLMPDGYGFIRTKGYLPGEHDVYVGSSMVRRMGLRKGDHVAGRVRPPRDNEKYPALNTILALNDEPFEGPQHRVKFQNLTPVYPDERLVLEHGKDAVTARAIDLVSPIGKGQRGLIVSPPKAGKTTVLKDIAAAISANNPEVHLMCLLVDERPEEVTDMERSIDGEVVSSTFDMPADNHIAVAELVIERAKRLVEAGHDVVILLDSITRLARAYNLAQPASGRILSGGVDSTALYPPKRFLGAARNIEGGGSLTILGTALVDTGSKMDEVIFEEFKGTGNMELKLDRTLSERRIFPAIDPVASSTRKDELLVDAQEAPLVWGLRRLLANMNNTERAMDMLIKSLRQTETNQEFLIKSARKSNKQGMVV